MFIKRHNRQLIAFILLFVSLSILLLLVQREQNLRSSADIFDTLDVEEAVSKTGNYVIGQDEDASGGQYMQFGQNSTPPTNTPIPTRPPTLAPTRLPTLTPTRPPTPTPTRRPTPTPTPRTLTTTIDTSAVCRSGLTGTAIPANGNYKTTAFGCVNGWKDPNDNCQAACGNPPGLCTGLSGPDCQRKLGWFAADTDRYGCFARLRVTNPKTLKSAVVIAIDRGPHCTQEQIHNAPLLDLSYTAAKYVGGTTGGNYEVLHVDRVSNTTPLGPTTYSGIPTSTHASVFMMKNPPGTEVPILESSLQIVQNIIGNAYVRTHQKKQLSVINSLGLVEYSLY